MGDPQPTPSLLQPLIDQANSFGQSGKDLSTAAASMATAGTGMAQELGNLGNLPAVLDSTQILQELDQLGTQMAALRTDLQGQMTAIQTQMTAIQGQIGNIETTINKNDHNNVACCRNAQLAEPDSALEPLQSARNLPITNFPGTSRALEGLTTPATTAILRAFGADTTGNAPTKKMRLRMQCGLKPEPQ